MLQDDPLVRSILEFSEVEFSVPDRRETYVPPPPLAPRSAPSAGESSEETLRRIRRSLTLAGFFDDDLSPLDTTLPGWRVALPILPTCSAMKPACLALWLRSTARAPSKVWVCTASLTVPPPTEAAADLR